MRKNIFKSVSARTTTSLLSTCLLAGCASTWHPKTPEDPYENYNRAVFKFNLGVDRHIYRPIAKTYATITPKFIQHRITNFFSNVDHVPIIANDILQLNGPWLIRDTARLVVNSTVGILGLFDVATHIGWKKHDQDFGLTMAKWGVKESPYFIFPFFQPTTARDFFAIGVDNYAFSVWPYVEPAWLQYSGRGLDLLQIRARLLPMDKLVDESFDPYVFIRDFYLQNRKGKIQKVVHSEEEENAALPEAIEEKSNNSDTEVAENNISNKSNPSNTSS